MDKSTNASNGLPRQRVSASKAAASFAHQLDSDESSDLEVKQDLKDKVLASMRKERAEVKAQYGKKKFRARASSINGSPTAYHGSDAVVSTTSAVVSTSSERPLPTNKKGLLCLTTDPLLITESDASDLTSLLSSTTTSPIEFVSRPPLCTPPKVVPLATRRGLEYGQRAELNEPAWSVNDLGSYVWVLLEPKSKRVYNPDRDENDCEEWLWWPAKIHSRSTDVPFKVSLFGSGSKKVEIKTPTAKNILSKLDTIGRPRFARPEFVPPISISSNEPTASPRKKLKRDRGDIEKQWQAAVWEMIQDGEEQAGSDHLPDIGEAFNYPFDLSPTTSSAVVHNVGKGKSIKGKAKRKRTCDSEDEVFWEPPPADASLDIPGELVLGRERASKTSPYWPAKIKDYVPPTKRTEQGKYTVTWLDASEQNIPRDWFYTTDEDGFALCTLGKFESSVSEVFNDEDEDEDFRGSASPVPLDRPPNDEEFSNLSIREQFVYTKTVLHAIMNDEYAPTKSKHSRFMNGGKQRASLTDEAALRGKMDPKDVERLQTYIRQWCLRDEVPADIFVDEIEDHNNHPDAMTDVQEPLHNLGLDHIRSGSHPLTEPDLLSLPPSSSCITLEHETPLTSDIFPTSSPSLLEPEAPPSSAATEPIIGRPASDLSLEYVKTRPAKQQGCEEYESLSHLDKIEYCLNILLPEAVRQILLWRSGKRTSMQLLSSEEEEDLYQEGQTLLNETDWVFDILRYRQMTQRRVQSKTPKGKNGTTSRPSRGFNAPNYAE